MKKFLSVLLAAAILMIPCMSPITAKAANPTTYYVRYLEDQNVWRFQTGSSWDEEQYPRDLYYMSQELIDGDIMVIDGPGQSLTLNVPVKLSNLTIRPTGTALITTKGIGELYVLKDTVGSITGDITNAYIYENARVNLNSNVGKLTVSADSNVTATITVEGTVGSATITEGSKTLYEFANFPKKTYVQESGFVRFPVETYLVGANNKPAAPAATAAPAKPAKPAASGDYDDVPKTGDSFSSLWYLAAAVVCFGGCLAIRRKNA